MKKTKNTRVASVKCSHCAAMLNPKNLKRHLKKIHSVVTHVRQASTSRKEQLKTDGAGRLKILRERAQKASQSAIASYLARNPVPDAMGKFGVPQDKYRWGFYGSSSMAYDAWGRPV